MSKYFSLYLKIFFPFFLLFVAISMQYYFDLEMKQRPIIPPTIIPATAIRLADLGQHSAAASLMWINTIQQISAHPKKLPEMIKAVNGVDPKFSYPYAFAALTLSSMGFAGEAVEIAEKGIREADSDWRIPYYLATSYHIFHKDRKKAAFYFEVAADTPDAPESIRTIAARYGLDSQLEQTKQIWISIYETSGDETMIERAGNYISHYEMAELLEKAVVIYNKRYNKFPMSLDELVAAKILKAIPESPLGVKFGIRPGGSITVQ